MTERTITYAANKPDIQAAFAFVMQHLDELGEHPTVHVRPFWTANERQFDVSVSGTKEEPE